MDARLRSLFNAHFDDGVYTRMLVSRPVMPLGRDIGFLPGTVDEKLNPWMQPNHE